MIAAAAVKLTDLEPRRLFNILTELSAAKFTFTFINLQCSDDHGWATREAP